MRLFLIWYQILMDNATEECHKTYQSLVTKLGAPETTDTNVDIFTVRTFPNSELLLHLWLYIYGFICLRCAMGSIAWHHQEIMSLH